MIGGKMMSIDTCIHCGRVIPEGRIICPICEQKEVKLGAILQSNNATEEEIEGAYELLYADIDKINDGGE
jgi:uncharacterized Zn finger protein (UPF0148 family)